MKSALAGFSQSSRAKFMQLGKITGKTTTRSFSFEAESRIRKTDYLMVKDSEGVWSLASIESITTDGTKTRADVNVIGFRDNRGFRLDKGHPS